MTLVYHLTLVTLVGALVFFGLGALQEKKRMKGAKPPPGPSGKRCPLLLLSLIFYGYSVISTWLTILGWPLIGNAPELATSNGQLIPIFNRWYETYGPIAQFILLGEKQVVLSDDKITQDLFVKRGDIYSDRGTPHAMTIVTDNINPSLMPKNGTSSSQ
jgi:hypothetical protein